MNNSDLIQRVEQARALLGRVLEEIDGEDIFNSVGLLKVIYTLLETEQ